MKDIDEIKRRAELLMQVNGTKYCLVSDLAKELSVKKTDLMQFIIDNPKLFYTSDVWKYKDKICYDVYCGMKVKNTTSVRSKKLGLGIYNVYLSPADNYRTDEWLQKQISEKSKYIFVSAFDNYGRVEGYFIDIDSPNDYRYHLWRNTEAKVKELQQLGITHKGTFYFGGFGDCSECIKEYAISKDGMKKAKSLGWTFNELPPLK